MPHCRRPSVGIGLLLFLLIGLTTSLRAQAQEETRYWPLREINFPVPVDRLPSGAQKPTKLRFYVRATGGQWKESESRAPDNLELIDRGADRRGFRYTSPTDGAYDFCLQQELAGGERIPRDGDLTPQYRVIFDTRPPAIRANRGSGTTLEWDVSDQNLRDDSIQIEARWAGDPTFTPINLGYRLKPQDRYTWTNIPSGDQLDVRIVARDKANHTSSSEVIRLAADGFNAATSPARGGIAGTVGDTTRPPEVNPGIVYSSSRDLKIVSKVQQVTRSGIAKSHLFVRTPETNWAKVKEQPETIPPEAKDPTITWKHSVDRDGRYGFVVIPENGAGGRDPDPRDADPAQFLIEVDTQQPKVSEVAASTRSGPAGAPQVDVTWKAEDANFDSFPIRIEYSETGEPNGVWMSVNGDRGPLPNTGRYTWTVGDDVKPWKFFLRVSATDLAKLTGSAVTKEPVKVDLATPKATIETIAAANTGRASGTVENGVKNVVGTTTPEPLKFSPPPQPVAPAPPVTAPVVTAPALPSAPAVEAPSSPGNNPTDSPPTPAKPKLDPEPVSRSGGMQLPQIPPQEPIQGVVPPVAPN